MGSRSQGLVPSFSSTSFELLDEDVFDDMSEPSTSNSAQSVPPVQRFKTAGTPYPSDNSTQSNTFRNTTRSLQCTIEPTPGCSRTNSNFLSRSLSSISHDPKRNFQNWNKSSNDLALTLSLPRENSRALEMDISGCSRNKISVYSNVWKIGLTVFSLCFVGLIMWYVDQSFTRISTDLRNIKKHMDQIKSGGSSIKTRKVTRRKLDMIESHLHDIKKSQQEGSCLAGVKKDALSKKVQTLVKTALEEYSADKTGRTDFALESTGGSIVSIYDTEPYYPSSSATVFGVPVCQGINGPRSVIQANVLPGECWSFKGSSGSVVVKLIGYVYVDGVSVEHISKTISPSGEIDSAPKDFTIWGLDNGIPREGEHFGNFRYEAAGDTLQYFSIASSSTSFLYIHFSVFSNHGNPTFTCVYRLRVHGILDNNRVN